MNLIFILKRLDFMLLLDPPALLPCPVQFVVVY